MNSTAGDRRLRPAVLRASSGYVVGHAVALVSVFVLAKYFFGPEDFGVQAQALAIATIAGTIGTLRLDQAVSAVREEEAAAAACMAAVASATWIGAPLSIAASLVVLPTEVDGASIALAAAWVPALALHSSLTALAQRRHAFGLAAWGRITASLTAAAVAIALGAVGRTVGSSLLAGTLAGSLAGGAVLLLARPGRPGWIAVRPASWRRWWPEFRDFALFSMPVQALADLLTQLPVIVLGRAFGTEFSGYLGLAQRIGLSPPAMLGQVLRQVVFPVAARGHHAGRLPVGLLLKFGGLAGLGGAGWLLLVAAALSLGGGAMLGPDWAGGGAVISVLAIPFLLQTINIPLSTTWPIAGRQRRELGVTFVRAALVGVALTASVSASDFWTALILYSCGATLAWLIAIGAVLQLLRTIGLASRSPDRALDRTGPRGDDGDSQSGRDSMSHAPSPPDPMEALP